MSRLLRSPVPDRQYTSGPAGLRLDSKKTPYAANTTKPLRPGTTCPPARRISGLSRGQRGFLGQGGYWWIAGNMMRDAAALANVELLPWDVWGAMPVPDDEIDEEFFDHLAMLTSSPGAHLAEIGRLCREDPACASRPRYTTNYVGVDEPI